jgi:hypothetical protein
LDAVSAWGHDEAIGGQDTRCVEGLV